MSKHVGARHDDGLGALRGLMFGLVGYAGFGLFIALVVWA